MNILRSLSKFFKLDGSRALTGDVDAGGKKITNLGAPVSGGDAVTKTYADALGGGGGGIGDVGARFTLSATQAAGVGDQPILWDQESYKTAGITHSNAVLPSRVTVASTGKYHFGMTFNPTLNAGVVLGYRKNGGAVTWMGDVTFAAYVSWVEELNLTAADYIEFMVSGNGVDAVNSAAWIRRVA